MSTNRTHSVPLAGAGKPRAIGGVLLPALNQRAPSCWPARVECRTRSGPRVSVHMFLRA
jgi:hypothetical protein